MERDDYIRIATVLYCCQALCEEHDVPSMAASIAASQLAGESLKTIRYVAREEQIETNDLDLERHFEH